MRQIFRAYYTPAGPELDALWTEGTIVLDTNTLLNFFRYTPSTRDEFLSVLESLRESLWIPHQVGLEFQRRRLDVISNTADAFSKIKNSVDSAKNTVTKTLNEYKHHPSLNRTELTDELDDLFRRFSAKVDAQASEHEAWIAGNGDPEKTFHRISDLYDERVGEGFTREELDVIEIEGKQRYEDKVPPGYKDSSKSNDNEYGDLVIWKEILRLGASMRKPLIFVTDDAKEDWWRIERGMTQGARPELIDEFYAASEQRIHLYEPLQFLKHAKERTQLPVSDNSLDEVKEVSNGNERALRVLQERRERLIRDRDTQVKYLQRRQRETLHDERPILFAKLDELTNEQRTLERNRDLLIEESETLSLRAAEADSPKVRDDYMRARHEMHARRTALEQRIASVVEQTSSIDRQLRMVSRDEARLGKMMARQMHSIDEELREVSLALDELES